MRVVFAVAVKNSKDAASSKSTWMRISFVLFEKRDHSKPLLFSGPKLVLSSAKSSASCKKLSMSVAGFKKGSCEDCPV